MKIEDTIFFKQYNTSLNGFDFKLGKDSVIVRYFKQDQIVSMSRVCFYN